MNREELFYILESSKKPMLVTDSETMVLQANNTACRLLKSPPEEIKGHKMKSLLAGGSGEEVLVVKEIPCEQMNIIELALVNETDDSYMDNAPLPFQSLDEKGNIVDVNVRWLEELGYDKSEVMGKNFSEFLTDDVKETFSNNFPRFKKQGYITDVRFLMKTKNGGSIPVSFDGKIMYDNSGKMERTFCIFKNIETSISRIKELEKKASIYNSIFGNSRYPIIILNTEESTLFDMNSSARDYFHIKEGAIPADPGMLSVFKTTGLLKKIKENSEFYNELSIKELGVEAFWMPAEIEGRKAAYIILRDIGEVEKIKGERDELLGELYHTQKMDTMGRVTANIAHLYNNLLTLVLGNAEIALMKLDPDHEAAKYLRSIKTAGEDASITANHLMTFSKKQKKHDKIIKIGSLCKKLERFAKAFISDGITVTFHSEDNKGMEIFGDEEQIIQALLNILVNAYEALKGAQRDSKTIDVAIMNRDGVSGLKIEDNGEGIAESLYSRIFEPLYTTKKNHRGMGLPSAMRIINDSGGKIEVRSRLGEGTIFMITWESILNAPVRADGNNMDEMDISGVKIIYVEDDQAIRELFSEGLREFGCDVVDVGDPVTALELIKKHKSFSSGVIVTDYDMPGMNGIELIQNLVSLDIRMPAVITTGRDDDIPDMGLSVEVVRKPLTIRELRQIIYNMVK